MKRAALVAVAAVFGSSGAFAQGQGLRLQRSLAEPGSDGVPAFVIGDRIEGVTDLSMEAIGSAELHQGPTSLYADRIKYFQDLDEAEATGSVRLVTKGDVMTGPRLRLRLSDTTGIFDQPSFQLTPRKFAGQDRSAQAIVVGGQLVTPQPYKVESRGTADAIRFEGDDRYRATNATFTTCKPGQDDWFMRASQFDIDMELEVGTARNASLTFMGVTTPALPWFDFSLNNQRKSGFLPPVFGVSGKTGPELATPYYLNLAPNYDATITPRFMEKRGPQAIGEGRYMQPYYTGVARGEYLPNDRILDESRWAYSWWHLFNYRNGWYGNLNLNKASDDNYFRDLASRVSIATQLYLPQEGTINYASPTGIWGAGARIQRFQTLQDPLNPVTVPYNRQPQLTLNALKQTVGGLDTGFAGEYVSFQATGLQSGQRGTAYPYVSLPIIRPGGFVTPKVGVNATWYNLQDVVSPVPATQSRILPIASVDSGLYFEKDTRWFGQDYQQTLEPRAYYLYVPYRNQNNIPIFDTAVADFNYQQLFSENYYLGGDRISNANQLTTAVVSRLIQPETGQELVRMLLGQRFYFTEQLVTLNSTTPARTGSTSPILAGIAGRVAPNIIAETTVQYGWDPGQLERLNAGIRWSPEISKVLNLGYRYSVESSATGPEIHQLDLSAQWPLGRGWSAVGRYNYDLVGGQVAEALFGVEYNAGCWIVRGVVQTFATGTDQRTNQFFVQLELDGFAKIGSNPLNVLRRNVPGYVPSNRATPGYAGSSPVLPDIGSYNYGNE